MREVSVQRVVTPLINDKDPMLSAYFQRGRGNPTQGTLTASKHSPRVRKSYNSGDLLTTINNITYT